VSKYPWKPKGTGTHYVLTRNTFLANAGFEFEVSVPWFLYWLIDPNDPEWLQVACNHDACLELHGVSPILAAGRMRCDMDFYLTKRRWLIWPTYLAVLVVTNVTHTLRQSKGLINASKR
jgi:hypothetical protein